MLDSDTLIDATYTIYCYTHVTLSNRTDFKNNVTVNCVYRFPVVYYRPADIIRNAFLAVIARSYII